MASSLPAGPAFQTFALRNRKTMKTRILFAEQFYYPEGWGGAQIPRDITMSLARSGFAVDVLCGSEQYAPQPADRVDDPTAAGVRIRRIPALLNGQVKRFRIMQQIWFCVLAIPMILLSRRPRIIIAQTNPAPLIPILALLCTILRVRFIIIAQDLYPEVMIADGLLSANGLLTRILTGAFAWAYRRAHRVVALGPRMAERILAKGVLRERVREISNWATGDVRAMARADNPLVGDWGLRDKFVLLYSGNLGIAHDFETFVHAFAAARRVVPHLHLVIVGGGSRIGQARALVDSLAIGEAVSFEGFVASEQLSLSLGVAHLALVTLLPGFEGLVVPSKLLGHMARAIPTLYIGPAGSDVDELLRRSGGGVSLRNKDVTGTARRITELAADGAALDTLGRDARAYYLSHLSRDAGLEQYRQLIREVAGSA